MSRLRIQTPSLLLFGRLALDSGFEDLPLVANCWPIRKESNYNGPQSHAPKRLLEIAGTQSKTKDDIATEARVTSNYDFQVQRGASKISKFLHFRAVHYFHRFLLTD
jgi:hypothetical protein